MAAVLRTARPTAFVPTTDPPRARRFYQDTLDLDFVGDEQFALVFDLAGTMLRVTRVDELHPQPFTLLGWRVSDIAAAARELAGRGVSFERFGDLDQDDLGIWRSPSGAQVAWFKDPDGNLLSLSQHG
ncbi:MAG: VOC family protein [Candidatus Dormibacteraeota bacterium]|nr:VOC family protein [Candidatus Dormibacteraeota bacterium]